MKRIEVIGYVLAAVVLAHAWGAECWSESATLTCLLIRP